MTSFEKAQKNTQRELDKFNDVLSGGQGQRDKGAKTPYYLTGARCFIRIGGKPIGVCQDFRWNVSYAATPIQTIDTNIPWDIDVGQVNIQATLNKIYDPMKGPEAEGLFSIMAASVHQPMVEIQVIYQAPDLLPKNDVKFSNDSVDFSMFLAKGMFVSISGNATIGQMSNLSASFVGVTYQNYASQGFMAYGPGYYIQEAVREARDALSTYSGGFL